MADEGPDTRKAKWLEAFDEEGTVFQACKKAGIGRSTVYEWRQKDESFAIAWHDVEEATTERMEREAYRRSVEGTVRDIYHQGEVVGSERQYSDTLLIFMLKARRPERYRDNVKIEHAGSIDHKGAAILVTDPELAEAGRALLRRAASAGGDEPGGLGAGDQ